MCVIKWEPIRLNLIKYLFQMVTNSARGIGARKPIHTSLLNTWCKYNQLGPVGPDLVYFLPGAKYKISLLL